MLPSSPRDALAAYELALTLAAKTSGPSVTADQ